MAIVKRQADIALTQLTDGASAEYDTFSEVGAELVNIKSKIDLITVTDNINLDDLAQFLSIGSIGTVEDFEISLVTEASELPPGTSPSGSNIGTINDFETTLIN